ncbi:LysR family transcriptional regulator [Streptomyces sp. NPDC059564]|uniref:LysR family transcriptional regulator n=1 Tax=Streptomyces sp. NPDC059564 TaxID=3346865 RepID=UPI0036D093C9
MERHEMEAFLTLAEELHFRRTSERLGLAQGRVSQTIQKLERRIGAPLFERTSRRVSLTAVGAQLRDDLLPAYRQMQRALADATASVKAVSGVLRVGYSSPMAAALILDAADRLTARYPDLEVQIQEIQLADPFGPIRGDQVQVQITELPVDEPDLVVDRILFSEERKLLVNRDHPLARSSEVTLEDLADTTLISFAGMPLYMEDYHYPRLTPSGRPIPRKEAAFWQEALVMVGAGKGVTFACARAEEYYARQDTVWLPFPHFPRIDYGIIWPRNGNTARVQAFVGGITGPRTP